MNSFASLTSYTQMFYLACSLLSFYEYSPEPTCKEFNINSKYE